MDQDKIGSILSEVRSNPIVPDGFSYWKDIKNSI
jgi:hypothetical protein